MPVAKRQRHSVDLSRTPEQRKNLSCPRPSGSPAEEAWCSLEALKPPQLGTVGPVRSAAAVGGQQVDVSGAAERTAAAALSDVSRPQAVLLCLLDLLPILERAQRQQRQPRPGSQWHEVLQLVLTHMEAEHRLALRRVYARTLPAFVRR